MSLIPKRELAVIRKSEGEYFQGEWYEGESYNFSIRASIQGTNAQVLQALPEGYRTSENYTLYTTSELLLNDKVFIGDKEFMVIKVTPCQHFKATSHYQAVVTKILDDGNSNSL